MARRPLTAAEAAWASWRVDGEIHGHSPSQVIGFTSAMADLADQEHERRALPAGYMPGDHDPRWRTKLARWFGR
jgi:hypothetical protein